MQHVPLLIFKTVKPFMRLTSGTQLQIDKYCKKHNFQFLLFARWPVCWISFTPQGSTSIRCGTSGSWSWTSASSSVSLSRTQRRWVMPEPDVTTWAEIITRPAWYRENATGVINTLRIVMAAWGVMKHVSFMQLLHSKGPSVMLSCSLFDYSHTQ